MLKYLRIAVTALSLTACVLLVALWVRSYFQWDDAKGGINTTLFSYESLRGEIRFYAFEANDVLPGRSLNFASGPIRLPKPPRLYHDVNPDWSAAFGFRWTYSSTGFGVVLPYWFPVLLIASMAALPWLRWRFSLRTLLIATTLVAVGLGVITVSS